MHLKVKGRFDFKEEDCPTLPISDPTDIYQIQNVLCIGCSQLWEDQKDLSGQPFIFQC